MQELTMKEIEQVNGGLYWLANFFGTRTTLLPMPITLEVEMV
jgi:hypothetical protein